MHFPNKPNRWQKEPHQIKGQFIQWSESCWQYHWLDGDPKELLEVVEDYFLEFDLVISESMFSKEKYEDLLHEREQMRKVKAYCLRKLGKCNEALDIFKEFVLKYPDNYHYVEDCLDTYLVMNDLESLAKTLNNTPISLIQSEAYESADQVLEYIEKSPDLLMLLDPSIIKWAKLNCVDNFNKST